MSSLLKKVSLKDIRFFAHHGFYPEEQLIGAVFYVDIDVELPLKKDASDVLADTVNYEILFSVAKTEMAKPSKLIETVAQNILNNILATCTDIRAAQVCIRKQRPPLAGEVTCAEVSLSYIAWLILISLFLPSFYSN